MILFMFTSLSSGTDLQEVRKLYIDAAVSKENMLKFSKMVEDYSGTNTTLTAYKAAALTLKAKFSTDFSQKKKLFTEGASLLEETLKKDASNAEIRMIRLSIQENAPKIVKYSDKKEEDKAFLLKNYNKQNSEVQFVLKQFVKQSASFTDEERKKLQ